MKTMVCMFMISILTRVQCKILSVNKHQMYNDGINYTAIYDEQVRWTTKIIHITNRKKMPTPIIR